MARTRTNRKASSQRGFTLVEVILAIGILAIMMTLNYKILKGITTAKRLIDDRREGMFIANSVLTRMAKELQLAVKRPLLPPPTGTTGSSTAAAAATPAPGATSGLRPCFQGTSSIEGSMITFIAKDAAQFVPDAGTNSGIVQISYRTAKDPEQADPSLLSLIREEIPNIKPVTRAYKNALRFPITSNLVALSFRYYDNQDKQWVQSWDEARMTRLPAIIEFTVVLRSPLGATQSYTSAIKVGAVS